jgi:hypothetical protein
MSLIPHKPSGLSKGKKGEREKRYKRENTGFFRKPSKIT